MSSDDEDTAAATPGARGADTLVDRHDSTPAVEARELEPTQLSYDERYQVLRGLGRGGMGEVHLCRDTKVGRDVAVKVMRASGDRRARERFLREGTVQAQLEHPGVVPVYDIGITSEGQPYLAMKRVNGTTLYAVLQGLASGDPEIERRHPRASLLSVIERVCETVAYAHSRGVVHRDLKPANIMLGDYGEVSVLDWGVAKLRGDSDLDAPGSIMASSEFTVPGSIVGTIGYMAPEQATGDAVDESADVYALGAMIYEVVTLERLHPESSMDERLTRSLRGVDARPSRKVPGAPAELDAICVRATELIKTHRYRTAGELLEPLREFLAGQRVSELRRELADRHARAARFTLENATRSETVRVTALRELGAAAVLDPENREMIRMIEALLSPSAEVPPEVEREIAAAHQKSASHATARSGVAYAAGLVVLLPILGWMGVRDWGLMSVLALGTLASALGAFVMSRTGRATGTAVWVVAPFAFGLTGVLSTLLGPFVLVPALVVTTSVAFTISVRPSLALRRFLLVCGVSAIVLPFALSVLGLTDPSLRFEAGVIHVLPRLASFPELPTSVFLVVTSIFLVTASTLLVGRAMDSLSAAERRLAVQAHRLRAMLPAAA